MALPSGCSARARAAQRSTIRSRTCGRICGSRSPNRFSRTKPRPQEGTRMQAGVRQTHVVYIRTTPEKLWDALTRGALTRQYYFGGALPDGELSAGSAMRYTCEDSSVLTDGEVLAIEPPRKLVQTWRANFRPELPRDPESRVTWEITELGEACKLELTHEHAVSASPIV